MDRFSQYIRSVQEDPKTYSPQKFREVRLVLDLDCQFFANLYTKGHGFFRAHSLLSSRRRGMLLMPDKKLTLTVHGQVETLKPDVLRRCACSSACEAHADTRFRLHTGRGAPAAHVNSTVESRQLALTAQEVTLGMGGLRHRAKLPEHCSRLRSAVSASDFRGLYFPVWRTRTRRTFRARPHLPRL